MIYFIQDSATGFIKIGHAKNPWARLSQIQSHCPGEVTILATEDGAREREGVLHSVFIADRIRGEWFADSPKLLSYIASLATPARPPGKHRRDHWGHCGLNDVELGKLIGVSHTQLNRIRRKVSIPTGKTARKIEAVTGIPAARLVMGEAF